MLAASGLPLGSTATHGKAQKQMQPTTPTEVDTSALMAVLIPILVVSAIIGIVMIIANWKIFTKAGQPGWASIIPIYNVIVLLQIVGRPLWWLVLMLIPGVNIIVAIIVTIDLAKSFGKGAGFAIVGLILFSVIGYLMLAFGDARYHGPAALQA